jgi:prepilin-type N-terminal cleavage/methylation domain-containing protein
MASALKRRKRMSALPCRSFAARQAFTLVEMLVAMALTLILVVAISEFYAFLGETVRDGRASIEIQGQLRGASQRLKMDLDLVTLPIVPCADDGCAPGYFVIAEGRGNDWDANGNGQLDELDDLDSDGMPELIEDGGTNLLGDVDDLLAFTARAAESPWTGTTIVVEVATGAHDPGTVNGEFQVRMETSQVAEIAWWTSFNDGAGSSAGTWDFAEPRSIHRRVLLIRPDLNRVHPSDPNGMTTVPYFVRLPATNDAESLDAYLSLMQSCDVSIRYVGRDSGNSHAYFAANSLGDLTRREFRFMNVWGAFPNRLDLNPHYLGGSSQTRGDPSNSYSQYRWVLGGDRRGEDVALSSALAFDVRVFDPTAPLVADHANDPKVAVQAGDPGWNRVAAHTPIGQGAFVDLHYGRYSNLVTQSLFSDQMNLKCLLDDPSNSSRPVFYDTWARSYEKDGDNQDGDVDANTASPLIDEASNGLDDDGQNGVDDAGERETEPPYPYPLRGIEVTIRIYEPGTRQARQATIGADFQPE